MTTPASFSIRKTVVFDMSVFLATLRVLSPSAYNFTTRAERRAVIRCVLYCLIRTGFGASRSDLRVLVLASARTTKLRLNSIRRPPGVRSFGLFLYRLQDGTVDARVGHDLEVT